MQTVEQQMGVEALNEWLDHPVTGWLAQVIQDRADFAVTSRANTFCPGEPNKTHERINYLNGSVNELNLIFGVLNENWEKDEQCPLNYLAVEADDE
jgi:hypothetical protein